MIGVTIGVGPKYTRQARDMGARVKRHYGVSHVVVLGRDQMDRHCPPASSFQDGELERIFYLKLCVPLILPGVDRWLYFDADYAPVRDAEPQVRDALHSDTRFIAVQDVGVGAETPQYPGRTYVNAGFYVANRTEHGDLFSWVRSEYHRIPKRWCDQCATNAGLAHFNLPVLELPYAYNVTAPGRCDEPIGVHGYWYTRPA